MSNQNNNQNSPNNKDKVLKAAKILAVAGLILAALFVFFNYLLFLFLPFLIAWLIAFFIQPVVRFLNDKLKLPKKLASVLFLLILFSVLVLIIYFSSRRIIFELNSLSQNFSVNETVGQISDLIDSFFNWLENNLAFVDRAMIENIQNVINNEVETIIVRFGSNVAANIPAFIGSLAVAVPRILLFTLILVISAFYICLDYATISKFLIIQVPPKVRNIMLDIKSRFLSAIYKYLRAYSILILITFCELSAGFFILGVDYVFLLAFIVALIDILPILGTGTVLIPWGIISIIQKDYYTGFGLLILYATILIIRNIIEPKIVGKSIGLYPVVTLIALYVGYNILGVVGMFLLPITILMLKNLNDEGKIKLWKNIKDYDGEKEKEREREKRKEM